jgi:hypothetical protein
MSEFYEKLGSFYLGREFDPAARRLKQDLVLYDSKDLNTHAVIIGMTGSGKTGLGVGLLEEALIDNIPVIAIDPKGDLTNLALTFPELKPEDFRPWINEQDALNQGLSPDSFAAREAQKWQQGLADWGQGPERIAKLKAAARCVVYTPGSNAGRPISILRNFAPPPPAILADSDLFRERIQTTVTGLLALVGIESDPVTSREHIFLSNIFETCWGEGKSLDLAALVHAIQTPPFARVGVMDLDFFYPAKDRLGLAMRINNLLAAPGFEAWMEGEPLEIPRLLHTPKGRPRASIFTISHLSEAQRMFFVTLLLNEILGWMRTQTGTSSLRAILYMDEIFGYFPPIKNPPSKEPLLTLLKQARAYGLGVVLSTQNPVDLDYKGLANTGTWFIGRLQTDGDKQRVLSGLEGAAPGGEFSRPKMEKILSGLGKRTFLLHNVHENRPAVFQTRWALSYLRGPMSRSQIKTLTAALEAAAPPETAFPAPPEKFPPPPSPASVPGPATSPAPAPGEVETYYLAASGTGTGLIYYPALVGRLDIRFFSNRYDFDTVKTLALISELEDGPVTLDWDNAIPIPPAAITTEALSGAEYSPLPRPARRVTSYRKWLKDLRRWARQNQVLVLYRSKRFRLVSRLGESEGEFRARLAQVVREERDLAVEKLRRKYGSRFVTLRDRLERAEMAVAREAEQSKAKKIETAISFGTAILGAFLGRRAASVGSAVRVGSALRSAGRMRKESMDVARARERAASLRARLEDLEAQMQEEIDKLEFSFDPENEEIDEIRIKPKSTDIMLELFGLVWIPYRKDARGRLTPDWPTL